MRTCEDPARANILGVGVDRVSMREALSRIEKYLHQEVPRLVFTSDASSIYMALSRPDVREIFDRADLITPDGSGVVWAAQRLGTPVPERVSGVDLAVELFKISARNGYRIYCLGAAPGVAQKAADRLCALNPGAKCVGARDGYFSKDEDEAVARDISATKPDILLVAMGVPRQEQFILKTQEIIRAKVAMGVGGSFDVLSGTKRRAPVIFQKLKLEWLWRLCQDPSKIHRIIAIVKFTIEVRRKARAR